MSRVIHFEIQAADPARAADFYRRAFGWEFHEWTVPGEDATAGNRYWLVGTGPQHEPGINGGLLLRHGPAPAAGQPVNGFVCTIGVASLDDHIARVETAGGQIAVPRMAVRGVGWLAYARDPEGNIFGMMQADETAR